MFLTAGGVGYTIEKNNWSFISFSRADGVVWWEIVYGVIASLLAAFFWRKGLRATT